MPDLWKALETLDIGSCFGLPLTVLAEHFSQLTSLKTPVCQTPSRRTKLKSTSMRFSNVSWTVRNRLTSIQNTIGMDAISSLNEKLYSFCQFLSLAPVYLFHFWPCNTKWLKSSNTSSFIHRNNKVHKTQLLEIYNFITRT